MISSLANLLVASVKRYPDHPAVEFKEKTLSYVLLNLQSDQLASSLISRGAGSQDKIGIYMENSIDAVISIFGVLKAGACYVPLDNASPALRLAHIIKECSMKHLIISSAELGVTTDVLRILGKKNTLKYLYIVDLEARESKGNIRGIEVILKDDIYNTDLSFFRRRGELGNLAYMLYTSGSTGNPKGVMITHQASLAFINWAHDYFRMKPSDRIAGFSSFTFDLSVFDIFVTIKAGATLCLAPAGATIFPLTTIEFILKEQITTLYAVPSLLIRLLSSRKTGKLKRASLRRIIFAGEVFPIRHLRKLMRSVPNAHYYNLYGPTETNVCTHYQIRKFPPPAGSIPIGKPCKGTKAFIFNEDGRLIKNADMGELYISGPTLMMGYFKDRKKTDQVLFKKDNKAGLKGNLLYRTGDYASWGSYGNLNFHGRKDNMIKSRGYRVELGEIEAVLYDCPAVKEAVAFTVPDEMVGNKIKAAIVLKEGSPVSEKDITAFCSSRLLPYMVPEEVIFCGSVPKTATGKSDKGRLQKDMEGI